MELRHAAGQRAFALPYGLYAGDKGASADAWPAGSARRRTALGAALRRSCAYRGGRMELRMSSVCVSGCFASTGGSFLPPLAPLAPLLLVVSSEGVSYLTSDDNGAPGMATVQQSRTVGWAPARNSTVGQRQSQFTKSRSPSARPALFSISPRIYRLAAAVPTSGPAEQEPPQTISHS